eukprot:TRINITY_DN2836_c0_g1_i2.p1 TRINITY_DN2836_c0_g1~~TRINITY_DN2836_c0_g1_i2.p1  ORF type:complete len:187 (+),score=53.15 TRINITY_DN2836_c0_g1_i2:303-863(+)
MVTLNPSEGSSVPRAMKGVYLVDRAMKTRLVNTLLPRDGSSNKQLWQELQHKTVLDGELVRERAGRWVYYAYDLVAIEGFSVIDKTLDKRLGYLHENVIRRVNKVAKELPDLVKGFDFPVVMKQFYELDQTERIFKEIIPKLPHENDGLIFTPIKRPYEPGTCFNLLKWKPADENTVDFSLGMEWM